MLVIQPILFSILRTCLGFAWAWAADSAAPNDDAGPPTQAERQKRLLQTTLTGAGVVTVWGVLQWDYFSQTPNAQSEG